MREAKDRMRRGEDSFITCLISIRYPHAFEHHTIEGKGSFNSPHQNAQLSCVPVGGHY